MKVFGSIYIPQKIEFISYSPEYLEGVLEVLRKSFFQYESVCIGSEINKTIDAQKDLEMLCKDVLRKSGVSVIARDVESDKIVGVCLNVVQVNEISSDAPSYFEKIQNDHFQTANANSLMDFMITADSKVDFFEHYQINSLFEIMFLAVLREYGRKEIGLTLCKYSLEVAQSLKNARDVEMYLKNNEPLPQIATSLFTGRNTQIIGEKLGFDVMFQEPFSNYSFNGKTYSERICDPNAVYQLAMKML